MSCKRAWLIAAVKRYVALCSHAKEAADIAELENHMDDAEGSRKRPQGPYLARVFQARVVRGMHQYGPGTS